MQKYHDWEMFFTWKCFKRLWSSLAFTKVNKYPQTNTAAENPQHLKLEVAEQKFPSCSYLIDRTCYCPM